MASNNENDYSFKFRVDPLDWARMQKLFEQPNMGVNFHTAFDPAAGNYKHTTQAPEYGHTKQQQANYDDMAYWLKYPNAPTGPYQAPEGATDYEGRANSMKLDFGKHKGVHIHQIDSQYLEWCIAQCDRVMSDVPLLRAIQRELKYRMDQEEAFRRTEASRKAQEKVDEDVFDAMRYGYPAQSTGPKYRDSNGEYKAKTSYTCARCQDRGSITYQGMTKFCNECARGLRLMVADLQNNANTLHQKATRAETARQVAETKLRQAEYMKASGYTSIACTLCNGLGFKPGHNMWSMSEDRWCACQTGAGMAARFWREKAKSAQMGTSYGGANAASPRATNIGKAACKEVIAAGRQALARKFHPDTEQGKQHPGKMAELNASADWLEKCAETRP